MKKVPAFCHFQQLMGANKRSGPVVDRLWVNDLIGFWLDQGQRATLRQQVAFTQARSPTAHREAETAKAHRG